MRLGRELDTRRRTEEERIRQVRRIAGFAGLRLLSRRHHRRRRDLYAKGGEKGVGSARRLDNGADSSTRRISSGVRP